MEPLVETECLEDRDPPLVRVTVAGIVLFELPVHDYRKVNAALGLPDIVCPTR